MRTTHLLFLLAVLLVACSSGEQRAAKYVERGNAFFAEENYEKARLEFQNALQIKPKNIEARYRLAETLEKLGQIRQAAGHLLGIINEDPEHVPARVKMGQLYLLGRATDKAREMVDEVMALSPNNPEALLIEAGLKALEGDRPTAVAIAERALDFDPDNVNAIAFLATAYNERGDSGQARRLLAHGIETNPDEMSLRVVLAEIASKNTDHSTAIAQMQQVVERKPENLAYRVLLARYQIAAADNEAAEATLRAAVDALPESHQAKSMLVEFLGQTGDRATAETQLRAFVDAEPENYQLQLALAEFHARGDERDQARRVLLDLVAQDRIGGPEKIIALNRLAAIAVKDGDIPQAEDYLAQVLESNPQDIGGLTQRGRLAMKRSDHLGAIADFRAASKNAPNNSELKRLLARAHTANGDKALALDLLREASEQDPGNIDLRFDYLRALAETGDAGRVIDELEQLLEEDPKNTRALETLFRAKIATQDLEGAKAVAIRIQETFPDKAQGYYLQGLLGQRDKDFAGSIASFEKALATDSTLVEPLTQMVKSYLALEQPEEALKRLDAAIAANDKNFVAHNLRGEVLFVQEKLPEAREAFQKAIDVFPRWSTPYKNVARIYAKEGYSDAVETILSEALEPTNFANDIAVNLSALYQRQQRFDESIALYEKVLGANPNSEPAMNNLAMLLANHRDDEESLTTAANLVEALENSNNPIYLDTVGWVRYKQGKYDEAIALLSKALEGLPENPELHYHLGMSYLAKGDREQAKRNLELAVTENPNYYGAQFVEQTLESL